MKLFFLYNYRRVSARQDTCALVAVSLNVSQKVHPCIWTVANLPHDCYKVLPVPKPIGGVLVMTQNCLLYLNQSVPPYAIGLNSIARKATNFPLRKFTCFLERLLILQYYNLNPLSFTYRGLIDNYRRSRECQHDFGQLPGRLSFT